MAIEPLDNPSQDPNKNPKTARIIPFPGAKSDADVPPDADVLNEGSVNKNWFINLVERHPLVTGVSGLVVTGLGAYVAVPGIHQSVDVFAQDRYNNLIDIPNALARIPNALEELRNNLLADPNPEVFDPSQTFSFVTTKKAVGQSIQVTTIKPEITGTKHKLAVPIPFEVTDDMNLRLTRSESNIGTAKTGVLDIFNIDNISHGTKIIPLIGGKVRLSQTINRGGVQTTVSMSFLDGEGHIRNLIYTLGGTEFLIPGATETYDETTQVTKRTQEVNVLPGQPFLKDNSGHLGINVSAAGYENGGKPTYVEVVPLTNGDKVVFINSQ